MIVPRRPTAPQVEAVSDVRRDNTGAGRFDEGLALPTTAFPSDHAIVSAAIRLRPAAAIAAAAAAAAADPAERLHADVEVRAEAAADGDAAATGTTLYDYWGIAELPPALSQVAPAQPTADEEDAAGSGGCGGPGGLVRQRWRRRSSAWELERRACGAGDRAVWVLFSPRPLSAALCQPWFVALLAALAVAPLLDAVACCRAVLRPPPAPAGRAFRFAPTDPRHAFLPPGHGGVGGICWRPTGGEHGGSGGALLAAGTVRLLLGGRDAPGAAAATVSVPSDGALVLTLPPGTAAAADGLACEAPRYPAGAAVALQVRGRRSSEAIPVRGVGVPPLLARGVVLRGSFRSNNLRVCPPLPALSCCGFHAAARAQRIHDCRAALSLSAYRACPGVPAIGPPRSQC